MDFQRHYMFIRASVSLNQALMLQIPHVYWMKRARGSGMNLPAIMEGAAQLTIVHCKPDTRIKLVEEIGHVMDPYFRRNLEGV